MQTWLPLPDYWESARVLDKQRLMKQHQECCAIFTSLFRGGGWSNHPAARMWVNYPKHFVMYWNAITKELAARHVKVTVFPPVAHALKLAYVKPEWLGREDFHASHRSNLLRKNPEWYGMLGWKEPPDLPYVWPV